MSDDWDPNVLLNQPTHECRIYGDDLAQTWAVVSEEDYQACIKHRWRWKKSKPKKNGGWRKEYLSRNVQVIHHSGSDWRANRKQHNLFLHTFIMQRIGTPKPGPGYVVDHRDGNARNCTRENLRWVTHSLNSKNVNGKLSGKEHDHAASL